MLKGIGTVFARVLSQTKDAELAGKVKDDGLPKSTTDVTEVQKQRPLEMGGKEQKQA